MSNPPPATGSEAAAWMNRPSTSAAAAGEVLTRMQHPPKPVIIADLNIDPPESDGEDCAIVSQPDLSARDIIDDSNLVKNAALIRETDIIEGEDLDQQSLGTSISREEKVSSLKSGLVHVARKMPKNAHAHFMLGLVYQRLGQPQKAILAFEKSSEILLRDDIEIHRPDLLSQVLIHHAQCILLANNIENVDNELEGEELEEILSKLKDSVQSDVRQVAVWNTLGLILVRTGRLQSAISILSSLLAIVPDYLDALANLGIAYLQSGNLEISGKCFQDLILKDHNHPAALINYSAFLLCKFGSIIAGSGAKAGEGAYQLQLEAANAARECLLTAVKSDPKSASLLVNLADAYHVAGNYKSTMKCLEQAGKLEPNQMLVRYAIAVHRTKEAERSQDPNNGLLWAANEVASILKESDPAIINTPIVWSGLAMAQRAQCEIAAAFEIGAKELVDSEERTLYAFKQAIEEDPTDAIQWHQLGLHHLCMLQFQAASKFLKTAVARSRQCSFAWSNLGMALQLSDDPSRAEEVYKQALALSSAEHAHAILSNLSSLYRQQGRLEHSKAMLAKALELRPGYAPALNNLGLLCVADGRYGDAVDSFEKALLSDPLLDPAMSNKLKAAEMLKMP